MRTFEGLGELLRLSAVVNIHTPVDKVQDDHCVQMKHCKGVSGRPHSVHGTDQSQYNHMCIGLLKIVHLHEYHDIASLVTDHLY